MTMPPGPDRERELEELANWLGDRKSITHFAWACGLACLALIAGGLAVKLLVDSVRTPMVAYGLGVMAVVASGVALLRALQGRRLLRGEIEGYRRLLALRRELGLDQPQLPLA